MADVIRPWLWPGIEKEVRQVLRWQSGAPRSSQQEEKIEFEDDGSNLRIQSSQTGRRVQILEFTTFEDPVQMTISDKVTTIKATIAASAAKKFSRARGKRITDDTRGGVFQIFNFEIVATHLGPRPSRLTLLIHELELLGSTGSGMFGNPRPIELKDSIKNFLNELKYYRAQKPVSSGPSSDDEPSAVNTFNYDEDHGGRVDGDDRYASLEGFATQLPPSMHKKAEMKGATEVASRTSDDTAARVEVENPPDVEIQSQASLGSPRVRISTPPYEHSKEINETMRFPSVTRDVGQSELKHTKKNVNDNAALLTLLPSNGGKKRGPSPAVIQGDSTKRQKFSDGAHIGGIESVSKNEPTEKRLKYASTEETAQDIDDRGPEVILIEAKAETSFHPVRSSRHGQRASYGPQEDSVIARVPVASPETAKILKGFSISLPRETPIQDSPDVIRDTKKALIPSRPVSVPMDIVLDEDPWKNNFKISRRDVRIPKDQQSLLDRTDSWLPPEPGSRGPVGNLPVGILQSCDAIAEGRFARPTTAVVAQDGVESQSPEQWQSSQSTPAVGYESPGEPDSDIPVSSQAWPSTPPITRTIDQLPPDSSVERRPQARPDNIAASRSQTESRRSQASRSREDPTYHQSSGIPYSGDYAVLSPSHRQNRRLTTPDHMNGANESQAGQQSSVTSRRHDAKSQDVATVKSPGGLEASKDLSSSESEMETAVPEALNVPKGMGASASPLQRIPSTALQPNRPVLLVKRTPYAKGSTEDEMEVSLEVENHPSAELTSEQTRDESPKASPEHDRSSEPVISRTLLTNPDSDTESEMVERDDVNATEQDGNTHSNYDADVVPDLQPDIDGSTQAINSIEPDEQQLREIVTDSNNKAKGKRRITDNDPPSPNITKRRKRIKVPRNFHFSQETQNIQDLAFIARQHREAFFASRKSPIHLGESRLAKTPEPSSHDIETAMPSTVTLVGDHQAEPISMNPDQQEDPPQLTEGETSSQQASAGIRTPKELAGQPHLIEEEPIDDAVTATNLEAHRSSPELDATISQHSKQPNIYEQFRTTYPDYPGDLKHFAAMIRKIRALVVADRMEHRSLWDDFIVRHRTDYREYIVSCTEGADDPMPYERFYRNEVDEPKYTKRIITPDNLNDVLELDDQVPDATEKQDGPQRGITTTKRFNHSSHDTPMDNQPTHVECDFTHPLNKDVIDLTKDNHEPPTNDGLPETPSPPPSSKKTPRALPWTKLKPPVNTSPASPKQKFPHRTSPATKLRTPALYQPYARYNHGKSPSHKPCSEPPPSDIHPPKTTPSKPPHQSTHTHIHSPISRPETSRSAHSSVIDWLDKNSSSSNTSSPSLVPEAGNSKGGEKAKHKKEARGRDGQQQDNEWFRDANTPFKSFVRAYLSIQPGRGNGFKKEQTKTEKGKGKAKEVRDTPERRYRIDAHADGNAEAEGKTEKDGIVLAERKKLDILSWTL